MAVRVEDIMDDYQRLGEMWQACRRKWRETDDFLKGKGGVRLWEGGKSWPEHFTSVARAKVANAVTLMSISKLVAHRNPIGDGTEAKERANKIELWMQKLFDLCAREEPMPPLVAMWSNLVTYGYAVRELALDKEAMKEKEPGRTWMPIRIKAPHVDTVLIDPMERRPSLALKMSVVNGETLRALSLRRKAQRAFPVEVVTPDKPRQMYRVIERWTAEEHAVTAQAVDVKEAVEGIVGVGRLLWVEPNTWGFVPFDHAFSGWGRQSIGMSLTEYAERQAEGVLDAIKPDILREWQLTSAIDAMITRRAFAPLISPYEPEELLEHINKDDAIQGNVAEFGEFPYKDAPQSFFAMQESGRRNIEYGSYPDQLTGLQEVGGQPVGTTAILREAGLRRFNVVRDQLNWLASNTARDVLRLVEALREVRGLEVRIEGEGLSADDIGRDYNIDMRVVIVDPVIKLQQDEKTVGLFERKLLDWESAQENLGHEDPLKIRAGLYEDMVWQHPAMIEYGAKRAAERLKALSIIEEWEREQQQKARGVSGAVEARQGQVAPMPSEVPMQAGNIPGPAEAARSMNLGMEQMRRIVGGGSASRNGGQPHA